MTTQIQIPEYDKNALSTAREQIRLAVVEQLRQAEELSYDNLRHAFDIVKSILGNAEDSFSKILALTF